MPELEGEELDARVDEDRLLGVIPDEIGAEAHLIEERTTGMRVEVFCGGDRGIGREQGAGWGVAEDLLPVGIREREGFNKPGLDEQSWEEEDGSEEGIEGRAVGWERRERDGELGESLSEEGHGDEGIPEEVALAGPGEEEECEQGEQVGRSWAEAGVRHSCDQGEDREEEGEVGDALWGRGLPFDDELLRGAIGHQIRDVGEDGSEARVEEGGEEREGGGGEEPAEGVGGESAREVEERSDGFAGGEEEEENQACDESAVQVDPGSHDEREEEQVGRAELAGGEARQDYGEEHERQP